MKSCRIQFLSLILAALIAKSAHGTVTPGCWEKVSDVGEPDSLRFRLL